PDDPACDYLDRQYMLGDAVMVAPVFSEAGDVEFYLPEGRWTHQERGLTLNVSELNAASWYQRVTFTLTNLYAQAVDLNQLQLNF
ncbi:hypothetical protein MJM04_32865, partial [Salmonella enterica subsp. enterica serovar Cerro]|nr:hypothetical protein [Salmonella enterica subsp. enterica serovar Cerro]